MKINFAARVDIGIKEENDDRVMINGNLMDSGSLEDMTEPPLVAVVCDGCGGYKGGDIAAEIALKSLGRETPAALAEPSYLAYALDRCQELVMEEKHKGADFSEMCTTIAGCIFCDEKTLIFHSGDSRVYRYDEWGLAKMTKDHSLVQELIDLGEILPEEATFHPKRNVISRCIGIEGPPPEIYISNNPINAGEKYIICSDGLWEYVDQEQISEVIANENSIAEVANTLTEMAVNNGSEDNISVIICSRQG